MCKTSSNLLFLLVYSQIIPYIIYYNKNNLQIKGLMCIWIPLRQTHDCKTKKKNFVRACYANFNQNIAGGVLEMLPIVFFYSGILRKYFLYVAYSAKNFFWDILRLHRKFPKKQHIGVMAGHMKFFKNFQQTLLLMILGTSQEAGTRILTFFFTSNTCSR